MMNDMKLIKISIFFFTFTNLFYLNQLYASQSLTPHNAEYSVNIRGIKGKLITSLESSKSTYKSRSMIQASGFAKLLLRGSIRELSVFNETQNSIYPNTFSSIDALSRKPRKINLRFDLDENIVKGNIDNETIRLEFDQATYDRESLKYALMHYLLNNKKLVNFKLIEDNELKQLLITSIGTKLIKTPYGEFEAIGIKHSGVNSSKESILWCVEKLGYLPVRIEQYRNNKPWMTAVLIKYNNLLILP